MLGLQSVALKLLELLQSLQLVHANALGAPGCINIGIHQFVHVEAADQKVVRTARGPPPRPVFVLLELVLHYFFNCHVLRVSEVDFGFAELVAVGVLWQLKAKRL